MPAWDGERHQEEEPLVQNERCRALGAEGVGHIVLLPMTAAALHRLTSTTLCI